MPNLGFVNAELIVQEGGLAPLVELLSSSNEGLQQQSAGALWSLSVNAENHIKIVREGSLPYLVRLLQSANHKIQEQAAGTLRNLAVNDDNKMKIVQEGALPHLIGLLRSSHDSVLIQAAGSVRNLSVHPQNEFKIVQEGGIKPMWTSCAPQITRWLSRRLCAFAIFLSMTRIRYILGPTGRCLR